MKCGLNFFPSCRPVWKSAEEYFREALDLCELADTLGYATVKIVEHYFRPYGGYSPSPLIFLAAAAQRTSHVRLVTGAVLPAFNHPLKLAAELALVDCISGGRLDAGFARASLPHEFEAFEVSMEESRPRFEEGIAVVFQETAVAWTGRRSAQYRGYERLAALLEGMTYDRVLAEGRTFIGDPVTVLDGIHRVRDIFGPVQTEMQVMFGDMPYDNARRSIELFGREVLPALRDL
jgi:alkanesulfonate monooxygenase SsuD/methylene tetrahydromethanopterin reductase-like flavin-dependent oxidoreductase (luciferase family)